jgi:hypothetical protein
MSQLPPSPEEATKRAMANAAQKMAMDRAEGMFWKLVKPYLPATIIANLQKQASKAIWGAISGCIFTIFFTLACALVIVLVGGYVAYKVMFP